ncbi:MAG: TlpA family protein disulfide reductase [Clostridiales bacterium]|nr:TlpA family protein disulfide reductase [Clostridiales bacterium]
MKNLFRTLLYSGIIASVLFAASACGTTRNEEPVVVETPAEVEQPSENVAEEQPAEAVTDDTYEPLILDDFKLLTLDGEETSLYAYEGKTILLNFWATWCGYCVQEMPVLDAFNERDDLVVLAISVGEDEDTVREYIEENGYSFEVFLDESGELGEAFGVTGLPTTLFLGPDFEYFYSFPGMLTEETLTEILSVIEGIRSERN